MKKILVVACTLFVPGLYPALAQITLDSTVVSEETIVTNLEVPWEILWGPDNRIWFTERNDGRVGRVDPATGIRDTLLELPDVFHTSESGLLGMTLHPDFTNPDSAFVYLVYTYQASGSVMLEKLVRYTFQVDTLVAATILIDNIAANGNHNGCRLMIGPDRKIYMTTGDAQNTSLAQNLNSLSGKVLRINLNGSVPADNPDPSSYIWSFGHRNPQGLVWAPNGRLYSSEHGPNNDDEINIIEKNRNYGWPNVEGYCDPGSEKTFCDANNVAEPIRAWTPTIAVAGLDYYNHPAIPEWQHTLVMTNLKEDDLRVMKLNAAGDSIVSEELFLNNAYGRLRDLCVSPAGDIYFATSNRDGRANGGFPIAADDRIIRLYNDDYSPVGNFQTDGQKPRLSVFPNPAGNHLTILSGNQTRQTQKLIILDVRGSHVLEKQWQGPQTSINVSHLPPGTYLYRLTDEKKDTTFGRFVLIR